MTDAALRAAPWRVAFAALPGVWPLRLCPLLLFARRAAPGLPFAALPGAWLPIGMAISRKHVNSCRAAVLRPWQKGPGSVYSQPGQAAAPIAQSLPTTARVRHI